MPKGKRQERVAPVDEVPIRLRIESLEEGGYVATSPDVPGLVDEGHSVTEAVEIAQGLARRIVESASSTATHSLPHSKNHTPSCPTSLCPWASANGSPRRVQRKSQSPSSADPASQRGLFIARNLTLRVYCIHEYHSPDTSQRGVVTKAAHTRSLSVARRGHRAGSRNPRAKGVGSLPSWSLD